jgi:hypothetical protein
MEDCSKGPDPSFSLTVSSLLPLQILDTPQAFRFIPSLFCLSRLSPITEPGKPGNMGTSLDWIGSHKELSDPVIFNRQVHQTPGLQIQL